MVLWPSAGSPPPLSPSSRQQQQILLSAKAFAAVQQPLLISLIFIFTNTFHFFCFNLRKQRGGKLLRLPFFPEPSHLFTLPSPNQSTPMSSLEQVSPSALGWKLRCPMCMLPSPGRSFTGKVGAEASQARHLAGYCESSASCQQLPGHGGQR